MAVGGALAQLRGFITEKLLVKQSNETVRRDASLDPHPCVGFRVSYHPGKGRLSVCVLGARHLPASVANIPLQGYLVKVKLYPGRDKFETQSRAESWPNFDETFHFPLTSPSTSHQQPLSTVLTSSKFLTLTVIGLEKNARRKSIGSVTWPLEVKAFVPRCYSEREGVVETVELWHRVEDLASGLLTITAGMQTKRVLRAKDQLELTLCHTKGEISDDDLLTLRVTRLRWSIDKAKQYQNKDADLYVKLSGQNSFGQVVKCSKTECFSASISMHWSVDDKKSVLEMSVPPLGPRNKGFTCTATLAARVGRGGKKVHLGRVTISQVEDDSHWSRAMQKPGEPITDWHVLQEVT